jgi:acyl-coenzyme A synthetase/AMP-(fatty) acid ligase
MTGKATSSVSPRLLQSLVRGLAYTQGDYARSHDDGGYTLHGRSDDVINVSGHRIGTEEIEGAILRDKTLRKDSPVGNVVVVGAPHDEKGETPVAFLIPATGARLGDDDFARLQALVRSEKGATAVPSDFLVVPAFPETRSGKYMRRTLRAILLDNRSATCRRCAIPRSSTRSRQSSRNGAPSASSHRRARSSRSTATCASKPTRSRPAASPRCW